MQTSEAVQTVARTPVVREHAPPDLGTCACLLPPGSSASAQGPPDPAWLRPVWHWSPALPASAGCAVPPGSGAAHSGNKMLQGRKKLQQIQTKLIKRERERGRGLACSCLIWWSCILRSETFFLNCRRLTLSGAELFSAGAALLLGARTGEPPVRMHAIKSSYGLLRVKKEHPQISKRGRNKQNRFVCACSNTSVKDVFPDAGLIYGCSAEISWTLRGCLFPSKVNTEMPSLTLAAPLNACQLIFAISVAARDTEEDETMETEAASVCGLGARP